MTPGRSATSAGSVPPAHEGTALFVELARVVDAMASLERVRSLSLPYPRAAQLALDRMVLYCLERDRTPPRSVPELLTWCRDHTAGGPLFQVPATFVSPDATLVDPVGLMPTRTCLEVASFHPRGCAEQEADLLLAELEARSSAVGGYGRCRSFLMQRPVVTQRDRFSRRGWSGTVWNRVKDLYGPVPESLLSHRILNLCGSCGLPALPGRDSAGGAEKWCETEDCPTGVPFRLMRDPGQTLVLRQSLRAFLALPGPTERSALAELQGAGIEYELMPRASGSYRVRGAGASTCFMRVYDRRQPALLAARVVDSLVAPDALSLVVVPRRSADRPGYRTAFESAVPSDQREHVALTTPEDLVGHVLTQHGPHKERDDRNA
ncbi:hypothetical protein ACGFMO_32980 [Streptomyces niveus]|uniref:pPIWI_RE_Y domain-containing protein n=1 Tax=Streptomyces niveus TaxID=193462 RepID=UPI00371613BD